MTNSLIEKWLGLNNEFRVLGVSHVEFLLREMSVKRMGIMSTTNNLPKKLRDLRYQKGWNQDRVASAIGVSRQAYSYYEKAMRNPSVETIQRIAELYNLTVDELLEDHSDASDKAKKRPAMNATAAVVLNAIEINNEDSIEVLQRLLVHNGERLTGEEIREILAIARYQLSKKQTPNSN